ncbi:hypothetical protein [Vibrio splendidus]|uniref:hypothetical protein n=1 Tax=Vibrio splendidus TaxID=29497 RepID=UPI003D0C660D
MNSIDVQKKKEVQQKNGVRDDLMDLIHPDIQSMFEVTNSLPICERLCKPNEFGRYISRVHRLNSKPKLRAKQDQVQAMLSVDCALDYYKEKDLSEYFKTISHAFVMSQLNKRWTTMFVAKDEGSSSLDSLFPKQVLRTKKEADNYRVMETFFSRICLGMPVEDQNKLTLNNSPFTELNMVSMTQGVDSQLEKFDEAINAHFLSYHTVLGHLDDENYLPNHGLALAVIQCHQLFDEYVIGESNDGFKEDSLKVSLVKNAVIMNAEKAAISHVYLENIALSSISDDLYEAQSWFDERFDSVRGYLSHFYNLEEEVLEPILDMGCFLLKHFIQYNRPISMSVEVYQQTHFTPRHHFLFCLLLVNDRSSKLEINLSISGETNKAVNVFDTISEAIVNHVHNEKPFHVPESIRVLYMKRYVLLSFGKSSNYPLEVGASAQSAVKIAKWKMRQEMYAQMKSLSLAEMKTGIKRLNSLLNL